MQAERLAALLVPWQGVGPAYAGLADGVRGLALDGRLPVGTRLPSERDLATALGVSRATVTAGYDVLRAEGFLRSARAAGSRIALPARAPLRPDAPTAAGPADRGGRDVLDLTVAALPAPAALLEAVAAASRALRPHLAGHGLHPLGLPELRAAVAAHLGARGLPTVAEQVLVTNGALHGWDLLLRVLGAPGRRVLVEQPTYPAVVDAVRAARARPVAVPVTAAGWELPAPPASLAHVTPDGQNPTGLLAGEAERARLLADLAGVTVVSDETFADVVLDGPAPPRLASLDPAVVTLGSTSKAFWAGLRVGWVRAEPDLVAELATARTGQDLAGPVLDQLVAAELLARADDVLPVRRAALAKSRDLLLDVLAAAPVAWTAVPPAAGLVLWLELPAPTSATRVAAAALDLGLRITPGPRFTVDGSSDRWLRLPFTAPDEELERAVDLLAAAVARSTAAPAGPRGRRTAPPRSWAA